MKKTKDSHETWLNIFNAQLFLLDFPNISIKNSEQIPIIYIVGVPRSGTTLASQVLSYCLDIGYINNIIARFWTRPSIGVRLSQAILGKDPAATLDFSSHYGSTPGAAGPHEFGNFWRHWFPFKSASTHHLSTEILQSVDQMGLKNALENELISYFEKPLLIKNLTCGFHAEFLTQVHKKSLFIHIYRNPYDTARSILQCRKSIYGNYNTWWSLKPAAWPFKARNSAEDVALQVLYCNKEITEQLKKTAVRSINITYEQLCKKPNYVIERVCNTIMDMGYDLRPIRTIKNKFICHKENPLTYEMEQILKDIFE